MIRPCNGVCETGTGCNCCATFETEFGDIQEISTTDYNDLNNKPKINDVVIKGDKEGKDYNLQDLLIAGEGIEIEDNGDHTATIKSTASGSGALESDLIVSNPIGKYTMDDVIPEGTVFETIFRGLLSKTYYPTLTDPSLSLSYGATILVKVGGIIPAMVATLSFNRGRINPQYTAESPYRSGEATEYSVNLQGASIEYSETQVANSFNIPEFTRNTKGNVVLNATVKYSEGVQPKDSDGNDYNSPLPSGVKTASKTIEFILPFYWGVSDNLSVTSLQGLTEDLTKKTNKTYAYNTKYQHMVIAYDATYGDLKSILDPNNFETISGWTKSTIQENGQNYYVWVADLPTTDTGATYTFKF